MPKTVVKKKQCAVIAYKRGKKGPKIVLVTSLETRRWVLPKGNIVDGLSARESAALEALEEAGVEGTPAKSRIPGSAATTTKGQS